MLKEGLMSRTSSKTVAIEMPADPVFATIIDIRKLPAWNAAISRVVQEPPVLVPGAEWVVEVHALGQTWQSRSRVEEIDTETRRFVYRSGSDDGNPSYAIWRWEVAGVNGGCEVRVSWDLHPVTFWRRHLLVKVRSRQLRRTEVPASLSRMADVAAARA
jgi:hypothetical protein